MKLLSLGLAGIPAPERRAAARPELGEIGATGTPIFGGYITDPGEYNAKLAGTAAFATYEQMRRSDTQVALTLAAIKLPIRGAKWQVRAPDDPTPAEQAATDFVRDELFEREIEWSEVLENALLMLDFGCAAHEDVWYVDGGKIRLKKLAPRLPITFNRWIVDPQTEDLVGIEQYGAKGDTYVTVTVPAEKLALFTFQREGSNYAGRSILRSAFQHWYYKSQLYKIDAIACERNGMGVPTITMGPHAKKDDRDVANRWVQQICAHEKAGLLLPNEWTFSLEGVKGTLRDPKDSIAHHNVQISKAAMAHFLDLGQTESGNRALGQSLGDFFMQSLVATANKVANVMNWTTITRLCELNFGKLERYPELVPQQILSIPFGTLMDTLQKAASSNLIEADEGLEGWLREKLGAPEKKTVRKAVSAGGPTATGSGAGRQPSVSLAEVSGRPEGAQSGSLRLSREPKEYERCLALAEIAGELDRGRDAVAGALRQARSAIQAEIVHKLVQRPVRELHRVSIAPSEKLAAAVEEILRGVYGFGVRQVAEERDRQKAGAKPAEARVIRAAQSGKRLTRRKKTVPGDESLGVYADAIVAEFTNGLTARAANAALDWLRRPGDLSQGEIIRQLELELDEQSDKWIDAVAAKGVNEAFADGRAEGYEQYADEIARVIYSALLDVNTCGNCEASDGAEGATPDDIPAVPNPDCDGGDKCRCVHVFVFADEELRVRVTGTSGQEFERVALIEVEA